MVSGYVYVLSKKQDQTQKIILYAGAGLENLHRKNKIENISISQIIMGEHHLVFIS
jgi:hypothetical protein